MKKYKKAKKHKKVLTIISNERCINIKEMRYVMLIKQQKFKKLGNTKCWHNYELYEYPSAAARNTGCNNNSEEILSFSNKIKVCMSY